MQRAVSRTQASQESVSIAGEKVDPRASLSVSASVDLDAVDCCLSSATTYTKVLLSPARRAMRDSEIGRPPVFHQHGMDALVPRIRGGEADCAMTKSGPEIIDELRRKRGRGRRFDSIVPSCDSLLPEWRSRARRNDESTADSVSSDDGSLKEVRG